MSKQSEYYPVKVANLKAAAERNDKQLSITTSTGQTYTCNSTSWADTKSFRVSPDVAIPYEQISNTSFVGGESTTRSDSADEFDTYRNRRSQ